MNALQVIALTCCCVCLAAILIPFLSVRLKSVAAFCIIIINAAVTSVPAINALLGHSFSVNLNGGANLGTILFEIDPLSAWFILIINITLINGALYGIGYMAPYASRKNDLSFHWVLLVIFHASMLWVCMLRNSLVFLIAWEIMTLSSLMLVMFDHQKPQTSKAGLNYVLQMHIGVTFLTVAFIWMFFASGSFGFQAIAGYLSQQTPVWLVVLFFIGFGVKAGFVPFHTWLPHAHPAGPSHVSGVMSGVIVKMGIYGILRIAIALKHGVLEIGTALLVISAITTLYGILNASVHRDIKKMLAFCTSENIGIVGMGIGLALVGKGTGNSLLTILGFAAALLHTLNHSLYKSLLFFASGNVYRQMHSRNMEHFGGLIRLMPQTAVLFLTGALAIGGLPPLNGFVSKFLVYSGFIESFRHQDMALSALLIICTAVLSMAGGVSLLTFTKAFGTVFLGSPRIDHTPCPGEVPFAMRIPLYIIVALMFTIGIFPRLILEPVFAVIQSFGPQGDFIRPAGLVNSLTWVGRSSLILFSFIGLLFMLRKIITGRRQVEMSATWGCGYIAPTPALQYTGKSFSKSLAKLFGFITIEGKKYNELKTGSIFPSSRNYSSFYLEFFETRLIDPAIKRFLHIFNYFSFIHNGKIQVYVLYGFFFVIILIVLSFMKIL
jgi:formate hydrogenlyase subunit 3/multisubunit Na+/H+ antiporter MnhD subunit